MIEPYANNFYEIIPVLSENHNLKNKVSKIKNENKI